MSFPPDSIQVGQYYLTDAKVTHLIGIFADGQLQQHPGQNRNSPAPAWRP